MYDVVMVADSINPQDRRIMTMEVTMPRFILAEFNTHRMFSRNSASSRAIPFVKMMQTVKETPFVPMRWMKDHSGMQGTQYFGEHETFTSTNPHDRDAPGVDANPMTKTGPGGTRIIQDLLKEDWLWLRDMAVQTANTLNNRGVHYHPGGDTSKLTGDRRGLTKQMCNRLLEPWMWQTVLVTATEWENFFAQRFDSHAEIHMQHIAELMLDAANLSTPKSLKSGEWHIPYRDKINGDELNELIFQTVGRANNIINLPRVQLEYILKIATMRCAQVSYTVVGEDGKPSSLAKLYELFETKLLPMGHWSPFEHCAESMGEYVESRWIKSPGNQHGWCGNFRGWKQYRKLFDNENRTDERFIKKKYDGTI